MPLQLRLIKSDEPRAQFRADARLRLWGAVTCAATSVALTAAGYDDTLAPILAAPLAAAFLLWSAYLALTFVGRRTERYTLTSARVEIERGVLGKRYQNVELWRIREVVLDQTLVERVRGAGRITLASDNAVQPSIVLGPVRHAPLFYDKLVAALPRSSAPPSRALR